jgi:dGTPase
MPILSPCDPIKRYRSHALMGESKVQVACEADGGMIGDRMLWSQLLDDTRIRKALHGKDSVKSDSEGRSEYERDRDRTIYSNPVRRLIGKTQVFPLDPNDHVRTRLVHSLEVSTVSEGLASQAVREVIIKREKRTFTEQQGRAISKIAETCGLLHDLGNPPFGHAGELAIASWFEEKRKRDESIPSEADRFFFPLGGPESHKAKDFLRFEGNAQTMRIVTNTYLLGHDHGLNLTCATVAAARKYLASSFAADGKNADHAYAKPGYFLSEAEIFTLVSQRTGTEGRRHPITFLVEAADDIVYSVVDIEDGVKKHSLTFGSGSRLPRRPMWGFQTICRDCSANRGATELLVSVRQRFCTGIPGQRN